MSYLRDLFFTWINKLRKKTDIPLYQKDWELTEWYDEDAEPISAIKILTGQFANLVYYYTYVKVLEDPEQNCATIKFGYHPINLSEDITPLKKEQMEYLMFQILQQLIDDHQNLGEYVLPINHYLQETVNAET